jgi:pSer/pThr/pTyr-binding forkhead associated (FHA) protein
MGGGGNAPTPDVVRSRAPAPSAAPSSRGTNASGRICQRCGIANALGNNFCSGCGAPLHAVEPSPASMAGTPVLDIAATAPAPDLPLTCPRCRGSNGPRMSFCQYCGARLGADVSRASDPYAGTMGMAAHAFGGSAPPAAQPRLAPAAPQLSPARLVVIAQDGSPGRHYPLMSEQIDIGREEGSIVLPNDPYVSPRHARLSRKGGRFFLRDLASVNGVYVRLRAPHRLSHADLVLIGLEVLRFEVVSDAERGLGPATEAGTQVFGSPALPRYARLCQRTVEGVARDVFYLSREQTVIGRESGDIVFTGDPFMSRQHAAVTRNAADNGFALRDLNSSNGTYVAIRGEVELFVGDLLRVGQHLFRLEADADGRN